MYPGRNQQPAYQPEYQSQERQHATGGFAPNAPNDVPYRPVELPRPLEPRPYHQPWSDAPDSRIPQKRMDSFQSPGPYRPEGHNYTQQLPGVRDLLSPGPRTSGFPPYQGPWNPVHYPPGQGPVTPGPDPFGGPIQQQPPSHSHVPASDRWNFPPSEGRRLELPIINTNPVGGRGPPSVPVSPYAGYPESARDYTEYRPVDQRAQASYPMEGPRTPFTPSVTGDLQDSSSQSDFEPSRAGAQGSKRGKSIVRFLRTADIPGKGLCHVYDDGSHLPAYVDGELVNPFWGLTKANKPRKRLALACLDCREKKIKCEPGVPSCLQCEKAKRPCRRANTQQSQGETIAGAAWPANAESPVRTRVSDPTPTASHQNPQELLKKRRRSPDVLASYAAPESSAPQYVLPKKARSVSPGSLTAAVAGLREEIYTQVQPELMPSPTDSNPKTLTWEDDPYELEPDTTLHLLELYFTHVNAATYCMFPRAAFMHWVRNYTDKCQNERMLLYAVLAMGSVFADDALSAFAKHCADIATKAVERKHGRFSIQLIQSRLILGLYSFARGREGSAWDHCGSGLRAISGLRLNCEEGCVDDADKGPNSRREFGFDREQLIECKRRTFWAGFLMDRYNGFCGGMLCTIQPQDIFLRLPGTDEMFEAGEPSSAPYFSNDIVDPAWAIITPASPLSPMAWLVLMSSMWGDVLCFIYRNMHRPEAGYAQAYDQFYLDIQTQVDGWTSRLPRYLHYNNANIDQSIAGGYAGTFVSMHALYHFTLMKLSRCARHTILPTPTVRRNIRAAHEHAQELLRVMSSLREARREIQHVPQGQNSMFAFSTPFPGYATLSAIDVLGAGGLQSELEQTVHSIGGGLHCLRELSSFWASAKAQRKAGEKRAEQIAQVLTNPSGSRSGCWLRNEWGLQEPLEKEFGLDADCVYGVDDRVYFDALSEHGGGYAGSNLRIGGPVL